MGNMARRYIAFAISAILLFILSGSSLQAQDVLRESPTIYAIRSDKDYLILLSSIVGVILSPAGTILGHLS
jgi:hypothetical protein